VAPPGYVCTNPVYGTNGISFTLGQNTGQYYYDANVFVVAEGQQLNRAGFPINFTSSPTSVIPVNMIPIGTLVPGATVQVPFTDLAAAGIQANAPVGTPFYGYVWLSYCTSQSCTAPTNYEKVATLTATESGVGMALAGSNGGSGSGGGGSGGSGSGSGSGGGGTNMYNLIVTANTLSDGSVTPSCTSAKSCQELGGNVVSVTATADSSHVFTGWISSTGNIVLTDSKSVSTTATINGNGIVTANFGVTSSPPSGPGGSSGSGPGGSWNVTPPANVIGGSGSGSGGSGSGFGSGGGGAGCIWNGKICYMLGIDAAPYIYGFPSNLSDGSVSVSGGFSTGSGPGYYVEYPGNEITITATPNSDYEFVSWNGFAMSNNGLFDGWMNSSSASYSFTMPSNNVYEEVKFAPGMPSPLSYVQIAITNDQGVNTAAPFQQEISFSASTYSQYERGNLGNIRFYLGAPNTGQELYSWCGGYGESGCLNSSSNSEFWVKIPGGIPAQGTVYVNMTFENKSVNYDGIYAGENPTATEQILCSQGWSAGYMNGQPYCFNMTTAPYEEPASGILNYGEFDNGAKVFSYYDNFASLAGWTSGHSSNAMVSVSDGVSLSTNDTTGANWAGIESNSGLSSSQQIFETFIVSGGSSGSDAGLGMATTPHDMSSPMYFWGINDVNNACGFGQGNFTKGVGLSCGNAVPSAGTSGIIWLDQSIEQTFGGMNGNTYSAGTSTWNLNSLSIPSYYYPTIGLPYNGQSCYWGPGYTWCITNYGISVQWARARAYPPNGIMPQTSFSQVRAP
jgi:hypothetical protein